MKFVERLSEFICHVEDRYTISRIVALIANIVTLLRPTIAGSSSFPGTLGSGHISGTSCELFSATAYNYTSGRLEFHDRRTRSPIKEPMLGARSLRRSRPGTCVTSRLAWYSMGVQHALAWAPARKPATKGYVYLRLARGIFSLFVLRYLRVFPFPLARPLSFLLPFLIIGLVV